MVTYADLTRGELEIPLIPEAATAVMRACADPDADARKLSEIVRRDAALATGVVRVAQSAVYGGARVATLQQAVTRLGAVKLREAAWVVVCRGRLFKAPGYEKQVREVFRHCLAAGFFAQEIAREIRVNVEEAFLAGLLHDVGRPILLQAAANLGETGDISALLDAHHAEIGGLLETRWSLAPRVAQAIVQHHAACPSTPLGHLVQLADAFARNAADAHPAIAVLNLYPDAMARLSARSEQIFASAAEVA
jgi:putative nucleotidyltransferase with HDIG domain